MVFARRSFAFRIARGTRSARYAILAGSCLFLHSGLLLSQQPGTPAGPDGPAVQSLLERIASLEAAQKQLLARVAQLERAQPQNLAGSTGSSPVAESPSLVISAAPAASSTQETEMTKGHLPEGQAQAQGPAEAVEAEHMDVSKTLLNIRGFGDFGLYGGNQKGQTTSFSLGQLNLFITSNISDHFKFLTELVFEAHQDNHPEEDLERILLQYSANDYFTLSAGRYHTAIGYYNTAYHHSTWFQTTTERPYIFEFEDEGGILPIHNVGVEASGQIPSGRVGLHYDVSVGNGRNWSSAQAEPVQIYADESNHKAVNIAVFARPEAVPGLQVGFSVYRDALSVPPSPRINETIVDGYTVLLRPTFEWLNEALMIRHAPLGQHVFETPAFYSQVSRRFGLYRPYFRYQYVNASSHEPLFPQVGLRTGPSAGVRFDPTRSVALKLQYDFTELRRQQPIDGKSCPQLSMCAPNALAMQVDFKF